MSLYFGENTCAYVTFIQQCSIGSGVPVDQVPTLVANGPHPAMNNYLKRPRGEWPPKGQLDEIQQLSMCLVLVGSKESEKPEREARDSWSAGELLLISKLPTRIKKGLIAAKCTFKWYSKICRNEKVANDGRSHVGSYHLKTTLLNLLETTPPTKFHSAFDVMVNVFRDVRWYLIRGRLPHYFLPECNLLSTVEDDERQIAFQAIQEIVRDPIASILKCPSQPTEIYGDICPDDLVAAFRQASIHPSCDRSWANLVQLLSRLDCRRRKRYRFLLRVDERAGISGRPELKGLVDMLETWK